MMMLAIMMSNITIYVVVFSLVVGKSIILPWMMYILHLLYDNATAAAQNVRGREPVIFTKISCQWIAKVVLGLHCTRQNYDVEAAKENQMQDLNGKDDVKYLL